MLRFACSLVRGHQVMPGIGRLAGSMGGPAHSRTMIFSSMRVQISQIYDANLNNQVDSAISNKAAHISAQRTRENKYLPSVYVHVGPT